MRRIAKSTPKSRLEEIIEQMNSTKKQYGCDTKPCYVLQFRTGQCTKPCCDHIGQSMCIGCDDICTPALEAAGIVGLVKVGVV